MAFSLLTASLSESDVELLPLRCIVFKYLRRFELQKRPSLASVSESIHGVYDLLGALDVQHAERAAEERREADAEHCSDVTISRSADNPICVNMMMKLRSDHFYKGLR